MTEDRREEMCATLRTENEDYVHIEDMLLVFIFSMGCLLGLV